MMDGSMMQSPGGDSVKKSKRRKKRRLKKQAAEKNEADTGDQLNDKSEAPDGIGDYKVNGHESEMDILETGLIMKVLGADSTKNISRGNASRRKKRKKRNKKANIKDVVQSLEQAKLDQTVEENVSSDIVGKGGVGQTAEIKVNVPIMEQETAGMATELTKNLLAGNVAGEGKKKRKKKGKRKRDCKMEITNNVQSMGSHDVVMELSENLTEETVTVMAKRKKKRKRKAEIKNEAGSINQNKMDKGSTENLTEEIAIGKRRAENESINLAKIEEVQSTDKHRMVTELTENLAEGDMRGIRKKRKKKKLKIKYEAEIINQSEMDNGSTQNFTKGIAAGKRKRKRKSKRINTRVEVHIMDLPKMNIGSIENFTEGNATGNRIGESTTKATLKDEGNGIDQKKMATGSVENLAEENVTSSRKRKKKHNKKTRIYEVQNMSEQESMPNFHLSGETSFGPLTQPLETLESQSKCIPGEKNLHICDLTSLGKQIGEFKTGLISVSNKLKLDEVKGSSEGREVLSTCNVKEAEYLFVNTVPVTSVRRKLLVLDVNGLLADVVNPAPKHCRGDIHISRRAIFRRPFCDDFLKFCFQNFDVGIWSSRSREMIRIVRYLLGDLHEKLLFCWDMSRCTQTGFKTLENYHKPLVCKELRKIWENDDPNLPWKKGTFDESNTLLVDDSPYKALLNPLHTAIFPSPYHYVDKNDTSLGPEGDIRVYLKELAKSEHVQKHVEQHPFGQRAIDEQNSSWGFYTEVLNRMSRKIGN